MVQILQRKTLAEVDEHGRIEGPLVAEFVITQKVLQIRVFPDLLGGFLVTQTQTLLDQQRTKGDSGRLRRRTLCVREVFRVYRFDLVLGDQLR